MTYLDDLGERKGVDEGEEIEIEVRSKSWLGEIYYCGLAWNAE